MISQMRCNNSIALLASPEAMPSSCQKSFNTSFIFSSLSRSIVLSHGPYGRDKGTRCLTKTRSCQETTCSICGIVLDNRKRMRILGEANN